MTFHGPDAHDHRVLADNLGGRLNARHSGMLAAWRQVFTEAGGQVPLRNCERMLRRTNIPVPAGDQRRLDLVVPGLNVARGLPLLCDVTVVSPINRRGEPQGGTSNRGGSRLEDAEDSNNRTYHEVITSGLGSLQCLGCEVYGRWSAQCVQIVPKLARERSRSLHPRLRRGAALGLQHRWWGLLGIVLQRAVANVVLYPESPDLLRLELEPAASLADREFGESLAWLNYRRNRRKK